MENWGDDVVFEELFVFAVLAVVGVEDVERGIVEGGFGVLEVVFHFEFDVVAVVVLNKRIRITFLEFLLFETRNVIFGPET